MISPRIDPTEGPLFKKTLTYAIPIMLTGVLQLMFNAADLMVVGQFCGSNSLAAVGATGSLTSLLVNLFIGMSVGAGVATAHAIGSRDNMKISHTVHTAIPAAFICGVFLAILGVFLSPALLQLTSTPEEVIDLAAVYMRLYFLGMPSHLLVNFGTAILRAAGNTKGPMMYLTLSGVVNLIFNVIFVTVFHMDVAGVALATTISATVAAVLILLSLKYRDDAVRLIFKRMKIRKEPLLKIIKIGLPAGFQSSMYSISNVIIQSSINSFGAAAISGNAAAISVESFVSTAMDAFPQTAMNFTGICVGAKREDRIIKIMLTCILFSVSLSIPLGILVYLAGDPLLSLYISDSQEAIAYGIIRLSCLSAPYVIFGLLSHFALTMRGMGYSIQPMLITVVGVCAFRIFWIYTVFSIEQYHTFFCLMLSYPVSWAVTWLAQMGYFLFIWKKRLKHACLAAEQPDTAS